jgi:uncharacterized membrane protein
MEIDNDLISNYSVGIISSNEEERAFQETKEIVARKNAANRAHFASLKKNGQKISLKTMVNFANQSVIENSKNAEIIDKVPMSKKVIVPADADPTYLNAVTTFGQIPVRALGSNNYNHVACRKFVSEIHATTINKAGILGSTIAAIAEVHEGNTEYPVKKFPVAEIYGNASHGFNKDQSIKFVGTETAKDAQRNAQTVFHHNYGMEATYQVGNVINVDDHDDDLNTFGRHLKNRVLLCIDSFYYNPMRYMTFMDVGQVLYTAHFSVSKFKVGMHEIGPFIKSRQKTEVITDSILRYQMTGNLGTFQQFLDGSVVNEINFTVCDGDAYEHPIVPMVVGTELVTVRGMHFAVSAHNYQLDDAIHYTSMEIVRVGNVLPPPKRLPTIVHTNENYYKEDIKRTFESLIKSNSDATGIAYAISIVMKNKMYPYVTRDEYFNIAMELYAEKNSETTKVDDVIGDIKRNIQWEQKMKDMKGAAIVTLLIQLILLYGIGLDYIAMLLVTVCCMFAGYNGYLRMGIEPTFLIQYEMKITRGLMRFRIVVRNTALLYGIPLTILPIGMFLAVVIIRTFKRSTWIMMRNDYVPFFRNYIH